MTGRVLSTIAGVCKVYSDGVTYNLIPRGLLKHLNKNITAGDIVYFSDSDFTILDIEDRKNNLIRPRCSNVDLMLITMSVVEPELSPELLYKFLTYANLNNVKAAVLFTKIDCLKNSKELDEIVSDLTKLDIEVFKVSPNESKEIERLKTYLSNKVTVVMGQTGVGKSSLINLLNPAFERKIGEYSEALGRGKHQTKEVIFLPFENGLIGDTPGFSSLELNLYKEDLAQYFPGYSKFYLECYFSNCLHQNEKQCKIKEEIENGNLPKSSYLIYLKLLSSLEYKSKRY